MYCKNCGSQIDDNALVCPHCGVATENYNKPQNTSQSGRQENIMAVVGFILSFIIPIAGLICSIIGYKKSAECGEGKGFAIAGIVISIVELASALIVIAIYVIYFVFIMAMIGSMSGVSLFIV